jgi:hypothetical protein
MRRSRPRRIRLLSEGSGKRVHRSYLHTYVVPRRHNQMSDPRDHVMCRSTASGRFAGNSASIVLLEPILCLVVGTSSISAAAVRIWRLPACVSYLWKYNELALPSELSLVDGCEREIPVLQTIEDNQPRLAGNAREGMYTCREHSTYNRHVVVEESKYFIHRGLGVDLEKHELGHIQWYCGMGCHQRTHSEVQGTDQGK